MTLGHPDDFGSPDITYIHYKVWDEIILCLFPSFIDAAIEVYEWIGDFITHFTGHVFTYP